ncbi:MAG: N-acetyl-gamma-glutamyl-phosphate reductase [Alphaproteobacteria bacterium MarineAlpha2_Bin1]|nr:MAG: N-acetyl-gamma-glutamyl-phosphate reductase [Alphaproteobacteria bacterium MarineAlpha2_Bin1]
MNNKNLRIKIGILGASGYTGSELVRLAILHPFIEIVFLSSERYVGRSIDEIFPHFKGIKLPKLSLIDSLFDQDLNLDVVFCCLPHSTSQIIVKKIFEELKFKQKIRVIDLSADFRISNTQSYEKIYGKKHTATVLQQKAVYGLTEIYRNKIKKSELIACPGCYPTAILLPLIPLLEDNLIDPNNIIIDAKSGVTGAGRTLSESNLFSEISESMKPYGLPLHRHQPEIEQELSNQIGNEVSITFVPHLIPINRGIIASIYLNCSDLSSSKTIRDKLFNKFKNDEFIEVCNEGFFPSTADVRGSNKCMISVFNKNDDNKIIIFSVIDNLVKGASGQAIQNMNLIFNIPESSGLNNISLFP